MSNVSNESLKRYNYLLSEINELYHNAAEKAGISDSVQCILYALCQNGERCLQSEISRESGISRQTINSALRRLEAAEFVYLAPGSGRNTIVCLTEKGRTLAEKTAYPLMAVENRIFDDWTPEELREYLRLTQKFRDGLKRGLSGLPRNNKQF